VGGLGAAAAFEQPVREVGAGAQLGDRDVHRADPGVEVPVPVTVAHVDPLRAPGTVLGAADRVGLGTHQRVDEDAQQLAQQVGVGRAQGSRRPG
jgi:hypothetical protein